MPRIGCYVLRDRTFHHHQTHSPLFRRLTRPIGARSRPWYRSFVATPKIEELLALDVQTRLALVQQLWDSIFKDAESGSELPISNDERRELDDRLREDDEHPEQAIPWQEARSRLRNGQ